MPIASAAVVVSLVSLVAIAAVSADPLFDIPNSVLQGGNSSSPKRIADREKKFLNIFTVVQFQNNACRSTVKLATSGTTSQYRNGTCFTSLECSQKSGISAGTCAAGFGVCCVFTVSASGSNVSQNCSYIQNPNFPTVYTSTTSLSYTLSKASCDVCYFRLDFESFTILGTGMTTELAGGSCIDTFTVTTNTGQAVPTICGQNTGQHLYLDAGTLCSDSVTLSFTFSGVASVRLWDIKVGQIPCKSNAAPPNGCLQYLTDIDGRFTTFNFIPTNDNHLASQSYSICIRQALGYCCVQYSVCPDANSMSLAGTAGKAGSISATSKTDTLCTKDYVAIPASSGTCSQGSTNVALTDKYCGPFLNTVVGLSASITICDCTAPFLVSVKTDALTDLDSGTTADTQRSRGLCLTYIQIPCNS